MTETKQRKKPTPKIFESIRNGALKLKLEEKVQLVKDLKESIMAELNTIQQQAKAATETVNGL